MADYGVGLDKEKALGEKMVHLGIRETDIVESFIRSQGPGGQNVNKTSTCIYLKHIPTGIEVKCQKERGQALNRYIARKLLVSKIETLILGELSRERQRVEKIRRQKRRRSRKAKLKMLEAKRRQADKKSFRAPGRRIAAVEKQVEKNRRNFLARRQLDQRLEVALVAVHAAVAQQPHEVQPAVFFLYGVQRAAKNRIGEKTPVVDRAVNQREILKNDPAGAQVHVADFGISHLPVGQPHVQSGN